MLYRHHFLYYSESQNGGGNSSEANNDVSKKIQLLDSLKTETPYDAFQKAGLNWNKDKGNYGIEPGSAENNLKILQKMIDTEKNKLIQLKPIESLQPISIDKKTIIPPETILKTQESLKAQAKQLQQKEIIQKGEESKNQIATWLEEGGQNTDGSDFAYELAIDDLLIDSSLFDSIKERSALKNATKPQLDGLINAIQSKLSLEKDKNSDNYKNLDTLKSKILNRIQKNTEREIHLNDKISKLSARQEKIKNRNPERADHIANRIQNLEDRMSGKGTYIASTEISKVSEQQKKLAEKFDVSKIPPEKLIEFKNDMKLNILEQFNLLLTTSKKENININGNLNPEGIKTVITEFKQMTKQHLDKPLNDGQITLIKMMRDVVSPTMQDILSDIENTNTNTNTNTNPEIKQLANNTKTIMKEIFSDQDILITLSNFPLVINDLAKKIGDKNPAMKQLFIMNIGS